MIERQRVFVGTVLATVSLLSAGLSQAAPAPKIVCKAPVFEFGVRPNTDTVEHDFLIRNDGDLTLDISAARPSCGCTIANISSRRVDPGQSTVITAKLDLTGREGLQHKTITVTSNDPASSQFILTMKGEARATVVVEPRTLIRPTMVPGEHQVENTLVVTTRDEMPLKVLSVASDSPHVEALEQPDSEPNRASILVRTLESLPKGTTFGKVTIRTNHPKKPLITVPFRYTVLGEIAVFPQELNILEQAQPLTRIVTLGPGSVRDFKVSDVEVPDESIQTRVQDLQNSRYRLILSNIIPTAALDGTSVTIHTSAKNMEKVTIPIRVVSRRQLGR